MSLKINICLFWFTAAFPQDVWVSWYAEYAHKHAVFLHKYNWARDMEKLVQQQGQGAIEMYPGDDVIERIWETGIEAAIVAEDNAALV